jgi:hypothetical protein
VPAELRDNPLERFEMEARLSNAYDAWIMEELDYHPVFDLPKRWYYQVKETRILVSLTVDACPLLRESYYITKRRPRLLLILLQLFVADPVDHTAG